MTTNYYVEAKKLFVYSQEKRRDFHMHPELGFREVRTASIVAKELSLLGLKVEIGIADTGVTSVMDG